MAAIEAVASRRKVAQQVIGVEGAPGSTEGAVLTSANQSNGSPFRLLNREDN